MAWLLRYEQTIEGEEREFVVILDSEDIDDNEFEKEYGARPTHRCQITDTAQLSGFPTDRDLEPI